MPTIRELRTAQGLSQVQLSVKAGVSVPVVGRIENGKPVMPAMFHAVCQALGVSPDDVTGVVSNRVKQASSGL